MPGRKPPRARRKARVRGPVPNASPANKTKQIVFIVSGSEHRKSGMAWYDFPLLMNALQDFMDAAREGDIDTLSRSPELVKSRYEQATALHFAAINGQIEAARWLLDHGADLEARDTEFHVTPLTWANEKGHTEMVAFLIERGAAINLWQAAALGRVDRLAELVAANPELLEEERDWGNVVHQACFWGRIEVLEWLIDHGANIRLRSSHGFTPLEVAERQARDARTHTPMVLPARKAEIEKASIRLAERLRAALG
jgi:hypothetical protein